MFTSKYYRRYSSTDRINTIDQSRIHGGGFLGIRPPNLVEPQKMPKQA